MEIDPLEEPTEVDIELKFRIELPKDNCYE